MRALTLCLVGVSHRNASVEMRERFTVPGRELPEALQSLRSHPIREAVVLSTCSRVECYVAAEDPESAREGLVDFLSYRSRLHPDAFRSHLYHAAHGEAAAHLFRVAAGLDSAVLGESEITAQVKEAYRLAHALGATGPLLNRVFQKALHAAKEIRSRTAIGQGQASIGSVVVTLTRQLFGEQLARCEVLLWGAGKAAEATARHLMKGGVRRLWIVNRTQPKAEDLASLCSGGWLSWEQALAHLAHVDIAIVCTQAPHYVIDQADLEAVMPQRGGRPLCLIDLAVPRNVDPLLKSRPGVTLYNIDDLQAIAQEGLAARRNDLAQCATIIHQQLGHVWSRPASVPREEGATC